MKFGSAIAGRVSSPVPWAILGLAVASFVLGGAACAKKAVKKPEGKTVLSTTSGETRIQVTEANEDGTQVVRITTTFQGKESTVTLAVDQPVYEIEIPLSIQQVAPQDGAGKGGAAGGTDNFQNLLVAQYLEKARASMMEGNYNEALKQVNLVLTVKPEHVKTHEMKGSIYYAMGNYQLANEEWEQVLALDPSNQEVRDFMDFAQKQKGSQRPPLPQGLQPGTSASPPPAPTGTSEGATPPGEGSPPPPLPQGGAQ